MLPRRPRSSPTRALLLATAAFACDGSPPAAALQRPPARSEPTPTPSLADQLRALTRECDPLPGAARFKTDASAERATVQLCQLEGAIWWRADADIDCDGAADPRCTVDRSYRAETSAKTSRGEFINSAQVPYLVVPMAGNGFRPKAHGIKAGWSGYGSAGVILYGDEMIFAPYADAGPAGVIGELSYAAAEALGINPDPNRGGVASGVTYIVFTGEDNRVEPVESAAAAAAVGRRRAEALAREN